MNVEVVFRCLFLSCATLKSIQASALLCLIAVNKTCELKHFTASTDNQMMKMEKMNLGQRFSR